MRFKYTPKKEIRVKKHRSSICGEIRDYRHWFAFFPVVIGDEWVWLEPYYVELNNWEHPIHGSVSDTRRSFSLFSFRKKSI